jgi:alpha-ketoglutarate-dependent taurine dioxygenase
MTVVRMEPLGVEIRGVDLGADLTDDLVKDIERFLRSESAVLFRGQDLDDAGQIAFAARFGKFSQFNPEDKESHVYRVSNREGFGQANDIVFHADNMFTDYPVKYLMLYGLDVTTSGVPLEGGETMLVNVADALDRLPAGMVGELATLRCRTTTEDRGSSVRPCLQTHAVTGQPYLVISQLTTEIVGATPEHGSELLRRVGGVLYDEAYIYRHKWREGDLLMWDNCLLQHARGHYVNSQNRVLRRSAIADDNEPTAVEA